MTKQYTVYYKLYGGITVTASSPEEASDIVSGNLEINNELEAVSDAELIDGISRAFNDEIDGDAIEVYGIEEVEANA